MYRGAFFILGRTSVLDDLDRALAVLSFENDDFLADHLGLLKGEGLDTSVLALAVALALTLGSLFALALALALGLGLALALALG
ncbi:MAG: hypothetical protein ACI89E_001876, partial [Planctomycetota bacterium]